MPYAVKTANIVGFLAKEETTYSSAVALSGSDDGILPAFPDRSGLPVQFRYQYDGLVGMAVGGFGPIRRVAPQGGSVTCELPFHFVGAGQAYSASVVPRLHRLWKASGLTAAGTFTGGSESYTYTPTAPGTNPTSLTMNLHTHGEKTPVTGALCDYRFEGGESGLLSHIFTFFGIKGTVVDSADTVPAAFTYPLTAVIPTGVAGAVCSLGSWTVTGLKRITFRLNRSVDNARPDHTLADLHAGFIHRGFDPVWEIVVAKTALVASPFHTSGGLDPLELWESGNTFLFGYSSAGAQYNRFNVATAQAQLAEPPSDEHVNGESCVRLVVKPYHSTPTTNDLVTISVT